MEQETNRMAHVEKASLLDEMEDDEWKSVCNANLYPCCFGSTLLLLIL
jgi:hypothetical protein